ncbi:hypothetical protein KDK_76800 [Dictyobacter kobayashii]|uniref:Uncharacterized protein n=1 Tax=Dictyobacter kobayashii TaxID=2014872 RepID=A0A402AXL3_9CHLR|nr:hypothetical protein KDK_76800 [Dictyobacter kobayashii]
MRPLHDYPETALLTTPGCFILRTSFKGLIQKNAARLNGPEGILCAFGNLKMVGMARNAMLALTFGELGRGFEKEQIYNAKDG